MSAHIKKSTLWTLANTNKKKTIRTQVIMCAYYKAFSVIYSRAELGPIFPAWLLFRHNTTTTTSQPELWTAPTNASKEGKNNKSGYLANQNWHRWSKLSLFSPERILMHLYGWSCQASLTAECVLCVLMYVCTKEKKEANEVQRIMKEGNEKKARWREKIRECERCSERLWRKK